MYKIYRTEKFDKDMVRGFAQDEQRQLSRIEKLQLVKDPYVGDELGHSFIREKKIGKKYVYYLVYDDLEAVLMVAFKDKKMELEIAQEMKDGLEEYYNIIKAIIKRHGEYARS